MERPKYLLPHKTKDGKYEWTHLVAKKSTIKGANLGLFASADIPKNTFIPYLGAFIDDKLLEKFLIGPTNEKEKEKEKAKAKAKGGLRWQYLASNDHDPWYVDGYPGFRPHKHFGCDGLAATALINEPCSPDGIPNLALDQENYVRTIRNIRKGEELFLCYGEFYNRKYKGCRECKLNRVRSLPKNLQAPINSIRLLQLAKIRPPVLTTPEQVRKWVAIK